MRILGKECKKILDIRLLFVLLLFTFLYYQLFPQIMIYPAGGQCTSSPYDMPFTAELIKEFGTTISDLSVMEDKKEELKKAWGESVAGNTVMEDAGITSYDDLIEKQGQYLDKNESERTVEEEEIYQEILRITFEEGESSKLFFEIQYIDTLIDYGKRSKSILSDGSISLLPDGAKFILAEDMKYMAVLLVICFFVLIIPYLIRERLKKVLPLYATTKTGKNVYKKQFVACVCTCGVVGLVQLLVYLFVFIKKDLSVFWSCTIVSGEWNGIEFDITYGMFMLFNMVSVWLFALGSIILAYWIGRCAGNYVSGIAMALPIGGMTCYIAKKIFNALLFGLGENRVRLGEVAGLFLWVVFMVMISWIKIKRELKKENG